MDLEEIITFCTPRIELGILVCLDKYPFGPKYHTTIADESKMCKCQHLRKITLEDSNGYLEHRNDKKR